MSLVLQSLLPYPDSCQGTSPHQQGWDTKMAKLCFGGIDVSKDRLDVVVLPEGRFFSVSNDAAGWAELIAGCAARSRRDRHRAERRLRARHHPRLARGRPVGATYQSEQASSVRPRPRRPGQERSARCAADRRVCRHHADARCAAGRRRRTARRDRHHAAAAV